MKHELRRELEKARNRGWSVEPTRAGHLKLRHPDGALVFTGSTPSCARSLLNLRAHLRRVERQEVGR